MLRVILTVIRDYKPMLFFSSISTALFAFAVVAGLFPVLDFIRFRWVFHVPLAILATGLIMLAALSFTCGVVLDTIARLNREQFSVRLRD